MKKVALIISVYNEESNIKVIYDSLQKSIKDLNYDFNICYVDDGSIDKSYSLIKDLMSVFNNITLTDKNSRQELQRRTPWNISH